MGIPSNPPTATTRSWEAIVRDADGPEYQIEHDHPVVYIFAGGRKKFRDSGDDGGPYE